MATAIPTTHKQDLAPNAPSLSVASLTKSFSQVLIAQETPVDHHTRHSPHAFNGREEKSENSDENERPSSESKQLFATKLGSILARCMAELCEKRPQDPIEFMSQWLYCYANGQIYMQEKALFLRNAVMVVDNNWRERDQRRNRVRSLLKEYANTKQTLLDISPKELKKVDVDSAEKMAPRENVGQIKDRESIEQILAGMAVTERGVLPSKMSLRFHVGEDKILSYKEGTYHTRITTRHKRWSRFSQRQESMLSFSSAGSDWRATRKLLGVDESLRSPDLEFQLKALQDLKAWEEGKLASKSGKSERDKDSILTTSSSVADGVVSLGTRREKMGKKRRMSTMANLPRLSSERFTRTKSVKVIWKYEYPPGRLVCIHSVLGIMTAKSPSVRFDSREVWPDEEVVCQSIYDHETYTCLPASLLYYTPDRQDSNQTESTVDQESERERDKSEEKESSV
ncbi:flagellar radial spoke protein 2-like [Plakobranchus ocellatus]|uniref:Flagellar radial spoke protein 2-like n=1 Tax=Plakobranchus ocellatus TaxID=259542 RepID=A0AAV3ZAY1_9GAST|nr:flagellar radial spoke protein 2-like [Plakobranchus ocellatus]